MEPIALRPLIDEAWSLVSIDEKASQVKFSNGMPEGTTVFGNGGRLVQVFVNLLRNSLQLVSARRPDRRTLPQNRSGREALDRDCGRG